MSSNFQGLPISERTKDRFQTVTEYAQVRWFLNPENRLRLYADLEKKRDLSDDPFWPTSWISLPQKIYSYLYPWEEGPEELVFIADECQEFLVKMFLVTRSRIFISFPSKS